jgi:hypothetical protein
MPIPQTRTARLASSQHASDATGPCPQAAAGHKKAVESSYALRSVTRDRTRRVLLRRAADIETSIDYGFHHQ